MEMKKQCEHTSKKVAGIAAGTLADKHATKKERALAGSALRARENKLKKK
jgi:hypothetical protein